MKPVRWCAVTVQPLTFDDVPSVQVTFASGVPLSQNEPAVLTLPGAATSENRA